MGRNESRASTFCFSILDRSSTLQKYTAPIETSVSNYIMLLIQLTGLSGSGKTTVANGVKKLLEQNNYRVEEIDGVVYRKLLCPDLGFSKEDRNENIWPFGICGQPPGNKWCDSNSGRN